MANFRWIRRLSNYILHSHWRINVPATIYPQNEHWCRFPQDAEKWELVTKVLITLLWWKWQNAIFSQKYLRICHYSSRACVVPRITFLCLLYVPTPHISFYRPFLEHHRGTMSEQDALKSLLKPLVLFANSGEKVPEPDPSPKPAPTTKKRRPPPEPSPPTKTAPKPKKPREKKPSQLTVDNFI